MSKILLIATFVLLHATSAASQDMRSIVKAMPDSIIPTLTLNDRLDFIDYLGSNMKAVVTNRLGGKSEMTTIGDTYTHIRLTEKSEISLKLLPFNGDSIICVVRTYSSDGSDSHISLRTKDWKIIKDNILDIPTVEDFLTFPDSISPEKQKLLTSKIEIPLIKASLSESSNDITFIPTFHFYLNKDDRKSIEPFIRKDITKKWNNNKFE